MHYAYTKTTFILPTEIKQRLTEAEDARSFQSCLWQKNEQQQKKSGQMRLILVFFLFGLLHRLFLTLTLRWATRNLTQLYSFNTRKKYQEEKYNMARCGKDVYVYSSVS